MPRSVEQILDELIDVSGQLEVAHRDFLVVDELNTRLLTLACHYANIVETDRSIQHARRCDKAVRDVWITAITSVATLGVGFAFTAVASRAAVVNAMRNGVPAAQAAEYSGITRAGLLAARTRNLAASDAAIAAQGGWAKAGMLARLGNEWARLNLSFSQFNVMGLRHMTGVAGTGMFADMGFKASLALAAPPVLGAIFVINPKVAKFAGEILGEGAPRNHITIALEKIRPDAATRVRQRLLRRLDELQNSLPKLLKQLPEDHQRLAGLDGPKFFKISEDIENQAIEAIVRQTPEFEKATDRGRLAPNWRSRLSPSALEDLRHSMAASLRNFWMEMQRPVAPRQQEGMISTGTLKNRHERLEKELQAASR